MNDPWSARLCPWLAESFDCLDSALRRGHFGHAWLLAGARGIGKSNLAHVVATRIVAQRAVVPTPLSARDAAEALQRAQEDSPHHPDLHMLAPAPDKRTISVEQVREAIAALTLTSLSGVAKALVIEPAEAMTLAAANALLKTLEEPTKDTYFFLVSHQPGLLPATIRSRCQLLAMRAPPAATAVQWLNEALEPEVRGALEGLLWLTGGAPLRTLELLEREQSNLNKELEDVFNSISRNEADVHAVVDQWLKQDPEMLLMWLSTRLEWAIKARLAPGAWTPVTDIDNDRLHNAWRALTLTTLFERWRDARSLLGQLGSGANIDLALRVLIQGFAPE